MDDIYNAFGTFRYVWYVGWDKIKWDKMFRFMFDAPKTGGTRCSTGRILGEFLFRLTPWNDSFHICGTQNYNLSISFFLLVSILGHLYSLSVLSRPILFRPVPSAYQRYLKELDIFTEAIRRFDLNKVLLYIKITFFLKPTIYMLRMIPQNDNSLPIVPTRSGGMVRPPLATLWFSLEQQLPMLITRKFVHLLRPSWHGDMRAVTRLLHGQRWPYS
ncbi:hypothetical protein DVH24_003517 [Malus domestica]|uniref:Uncharacterized protein n=1 Tax=Malus domestica TaxID=3750 RepID=A0A498IIR3_MALDO|nr:hypothetical protein DVH24_003517 [Malus domestica]